MDGAQRGQSVLAGYCVGASGLRSQSRPLMVPLTVGRVQLGKVQSLPGMHLPSRYWRDRIVS